MFINKFFLITGEYPDQYIQFHLPLDVSTFLRLLTIELKALLGVSSVFKSIEETVKMVNCGLLA